MAHPYQHQYQQTMQPNPPLKTYSVTFHKNETKFTCILMPLHPRTKLGAVVHECSNDYCRKNIISPSLIVQINECIVSNMAFEEVVKIAKAASNKPTKITFHECKTIHEIPDKNNPNRYHYQWPQTEEKATKKYTKTKHEGYKYQQDGYQNQIDELREEFRREISKTNALITQLREEQNRLKQVQMKRNPLSNIDTNLPSFTSSLSFSPLNPATTTPSDTISNQNPQTTKLNVSAREFVPKTKTKPKANQTKTKPVSKEKLENVHVDNSMKASIPECAVKTNAKNPITC